MARVYHEIPESKLALFSKFTFVCGQHYIKFRKFFNAEYKAGFSVRANSFDNVQGNFPIGFSIWDLNGRQFPKYIDTDVLEYGTVKRYWDDFNKSINHWVRNFDSPHENNIGLLICESPDLQIIHQPYFTLDAEIRKSRQFFCNKTSLQIACIYFAVRLCIEHTWLNDRDQFLYPNDGYKTNDEFQNDCLIFTLFHGQNRISRGNGTNHWIPFTEKEVGAKEKFESNFMSNFLKGLGIREQGSVESLAVLDAGRELWKYYHAKIKNNKTANACVSKQVNASFYDIREFFQGRKESGSGNCRMNTKSADETYNALIKTLRDAHKALAEKIAPKVYEYGFLRE